MADTIKKVETDTSKYPDSRYKNTDVYQKGVNEKYMDMVDKITIPVNKSDKYFTVTVSYRNRLDLVAYKFYNNPRLMWVLINANDISNPFDVPVGTILRIPSIENLYNEVLA